MDNSGGTTERTLDDPRRSDMKQRDKNLQQCRRECASNSDICFGFNYKEPQLVCELFLWSSFTTLTITPGCTYYEVSRDHCTMGMTMIAAGLCCCILIKLSVAAHDNYSFQSTSHLLIGTFTLNLYPLSTLLVVLLNVIECCYLLRYLQQQQRPFNGL